MNLSFAEALFIDIFCSLFGEDKLNYLLRHHNVPFEDTEGKKRLHDFVIVTQDKKVAIEIEGESYHNPVITGESKYSDDLLRANAQILEGWTRVSYTPRNLSENVEIVKKQLKQLIGISPEFVDYVVSDDEDEIVSSGDNNSEMLDAFKYKPPSLEYIFEKYPSLYRISNEYSDPLLKKNKPSIDDFLKYVIGRGSIWIIYEYEKGGCFSLTTEINNISGDDLINDALSLLQIFKITRIDSFNELLHNLEILVKNWADRCEKKTNCS